MLPLNTTAAKERKCESSILYRCCDTTQKEVKKNMPFYEKMTTEHHVSHDPSRKQMTHSNWVPENEKRNYLSIIRVWRNHN